jgi:hypothetical protein
VARGSKRRLKSVAPCQQHSRRHPPAPAPPQPCRGHFWQPCEGVSNRPATTSARRQSVSAVAHVHIITVAVQRGRSENGKSVAPRQQHSRRHLPAPALAQPCRSHCRQRSEETSYRSAITRARRQSVSAVVLTGHSQSQPKCSNKIPTPSRCVVGMHF